MPITSTAETYYTAAFEHLAAAHQMFDDADYDNQYYLTHLLAGIAVECMLRAYLKRRGTGKHDARHDLFQLAQEARFLDLVPKGQKEYLGARFGTLNVRWNSNHRYFPQRNVERHLQRIGAEKNVAGNLMENSARTVLDISTEILKIGEIKWQR